MKVGLLGGTFNPPHNAHLALAHSCLKGCKLDQVLFMPSGTPPHRRVEGGLSPLNRLLFTRIATATIDPELLFDVLKDRKIFKSQAILESFFMDYHSYYALHSSTPWDVSDLEYKLSLSQIEPTFTINTVRRLLDEHSDWEIHLIIGGDQAAALDSWKEIQSLSRLVTFCVADRNSHSTRGLDARYPSVKYIPWKNMDISSSMIREYIQQNKSIKELVPGPIARLLDVEYYRMNFRI